MANEVTYASLGDLTIAAALHAEIQALLQDKASLMGHPAIYYGGDVAGTGSTARKVPQVAWGKDKMAAVAEGSSTSNTAVTDASVTLTAARQALQRQTTDLAALTWAFPSAGALVESLAADMVLAARRRFTAMICGEIDGFTATAGTSGAALSVAGFVNGIADLEINSNLGPFVAILRAKQLTELQSSLRGETGPLGYSPASAEMIAIRGQGYAGSYLGVDIFVSSEVVDDATDIKGGMFSYGAVGYVDGTPAAVQGAGGLLLPAGTKIVVELERDAAATYTKIVGNYYVGVGLMQDAMGTTVISGV